MTLVVLGCGLLLQPAALIDRAVASTCPINACIDDLLACYRRDSGQQEQRCNHSRPQAPVHGTVIQSYGDSDAKTGRMAQGITYRTNDGARIEAPSNGIVVHAGHWRSYGPVLIINGGCGRQVLMMGNMAVVAKADDRVTAGQIIGIAKALSPQRHPSIYFEYRQDGVALPPIPGRP